MTSKSRSGRCYPRPTGLQFSCEGAPAAVDPHPRADLVEDYFAERDRRRERAELLRQEFDSRASAIAELLLVDAVGPGWMPIVRDLHGILVSVDPAYRLLRVDAREGTLIFDAEFSSWITSGCAAAVAYAVAEAARTCEVCAAPATTLHATSRRLLCSTCSETNRLVGCDRGEAYAAIRLARLLSGDPSYPTDEQILTRRLPPPA